MVQPPTPPPYEPTWLDRNIAPFLISSREICWKKSVVSLFTGFGIGASLAAFMGTFEGAHGEIIGKTTAEQLKNGFRQTWQATWYRTKVLGPNFAVVSAVWGGLECALEKHRGRHDIYNSLGAAVVAGSIFGGAPGLVMGAPGKEVAKMAGRGCLGFIAFALAIDWLTHNETIDDWMYKKRQEAKRENRSAPF
eukprot:g4206.t1